MLFGMETYVNVLYTLKFKQLWSCQNFRQKVPGVGNTFREGEGGGHETSSLT